MIYDKIVQKLGDNCVPVQLKMKTQSDQTFVFNRILEDRFNIIHKIGEGAFGQVYKVYDRKCRKLHAMKVLSKDQISKQNILSQTKMELQIMLLLGNDHQFLVGRDYIYQDDEFIFIIMKYAEGGDLYQLMQKELIFDEQKAKFYIANIALALGDLHRNNIVYRDLKPENILIQDDGYLALTDFGLSKILKKDEVTKSFCGTKLYISPEMLKNRGYSFSIDWWALGILAFELVTGCTPFSSKYKNNIFNLIQNQETIYFPQRKHKIYLSDNCKDFIQKCLIKNSKYRLGSKNDVTEIISHPWFRDVDFQALKSKNYSVRNDWRPSLKKGQKIKNIKIQEIPKIKTQILDTEAYHKNPLKGCPNNVLNYQNKSEASKSIFSQIGPPPEDPLDPGLF